MCVGVRVRRSKTRRHTGCGWRCNLLMCVWGSEVCRSKRGLSRRVSLEVSSDACTGGDSHFLLKFPFLFGYILYLYFGLFFLSMEEDIYLVNRLETNCRKSLIPFHAIWGLC